LLWFFTKNAVYHFAELSLIQRARLRWFGAFNLLFQVQDKSFQFVTTGLDFFDGHLHFTHFFSQCFRNFGFIHVGQVAGDYVAVRFNSGTLY
jgi:hypothetical protein